MTADAVRSAMELVGYEGWDMGHLISLHAFARHLWAETQAPRPTITLTQPSLRITREDYEALLLHESETRFTITAGGATPLTLGDADMAYHRVVGPWQHRVAASMCTIGTDLEYVELPTYNCLSKAVLAYGFELGRWVDMCTTRIAGSAANCAINDTMSRLSSVIKVAIASWSYSTTGGTIPLIPSVSPHRADGNRVRAAFTISTRISWAKELDLPYERWWNPGDIHAKIRRGDNVMKIRIHEQTDDAIRCFFTRQATLNATEVAAGNAAAVLTMIDTSYGFAENFPIVMANGQTMPIPIEVLKAICRTVHTNRNPELNYFAQMVPLYGEVAEYRFDALPSCDDSVF